MQRLDRPRSQGTWYIKEGSLPDSNAVSFLYTCCQPLDTLHQKFYQEVLQIYIIFPRGNIFSAGKYFFHI